MKELRAIVKNNRIWLLSEDVEAVLQQRVKPLLEEQAPAVEPVTPPDDAPSHIHFEKWGGACSSTQLARELGTTIHRFNAWLVKIGIIEHRGDDTFAKASVPPSWYKQVKVTVGSSKTRKTYPRWTDRGVVELTKRWRVGIKQPTLF